MDNIDKWKRALTIIQKVTDFLYGGVKEYNDEMKREAARRNSSDTIIIIDKRHRH